ncbi:hypothetical protein Msil_1534 [Methylocella silvestris BL2]|uniref:Uncharacterized protein n=1 Tax=Methylocella silvestris (strain DSM 15510 / CIP 108128 / LMG 27833 / NCIMB 13906 / BL2) TaxID=395965 RepID=B8EI02_METSB|nr:hypothetical protein Msil_1534 [Methylocella silvestris BL2]
MRELAWQRSRDFRYGDACEETAGFVAQMLELRAQTLPELIAKARAISWCFFGGAICDADFGKDEGSTLSGALAAGLIRDLLAFAEST